MIETALENSDLDLIHKAGQKMRNVGVATTESNDELGIKNDRYKKALETIQAKFEQIKGNFKVGIETFKNAYQKTNVEERKNEVSDIAKVYSIMSRDTQEMDR